LGRCERDLQKETEERNGMKGVVATGESDLKAMSRQKKAIEDKIAAFDTRRTACLADAGCLEKETTVRVLEISAAEERLRSLDVEREKLVRYLSEMEGDFTHTQVASKGYRVSRDEAEERMRQETSRKCKLDAKMKGLGAERAELESAVNQSLSDRESLEADGEKLEVEITLLTDKLEDDRRSFERLIAAAEKENARLEGVLRLHQQIRNTLESQQRGSKLEQFKAKLNEIIA